MIAIYDGIGAIWKGKVCDKRITRKLILDGALEQVSILIMPGGRDKPYHAYLKGTPNQKIRKFVEEGGTYFGICAGAYYGCSRVEFDKGFPLEVCEDRELCFFKGSAIGPAYGKGTFEYGSEKGSRLAKLGMNEKEFYAYYNGGPYFDGDFTNIKVLARYLDLPGEPAAIIECAVGKGKAILSGVHLESQPVLLSNWSEWLSTNQMEVQVKDQLASVRAIVGQ